MIFPVTGFPVAHKTQSSLSHNIFANSRIRFADFEDCSKLRNALAHSAEELFIAKAAWLSELLYRILSRSQFEVEFPPKTQKDLARYLGIPPESANLALLGLLWLSVENPHLAPLGRCFEQSHTIAELDLLRKTALGRRLLELIKNSASLDEQIEALLENFPDILTDEERLFFKKILLYAATARTAGGAFGAVQYGHALPSGGVLNRSSDRDWMYSLVLVAKIVPVWLADIRRRYRAEVWRLDQIPDAELFHLKSLGINGIWLVGLWQRSPASARIKQLSGGKSYASAYSVFDYRVADEWGGEEALAHFHARCHAHGIRLGCDMVPNHTGIDSQWLREHPDWFMQSEFCPFPNYRFSGENLSHFSAMEIRIEDGYYSRSDAAVVFAVDRDGRRRYIYHGNDGTGLPWNDTAQLDHTRADVRQAIIETALSLARYFSVIRFDAAMTLTRDHYRRLWFPDLGAAPAIASRAAWAMPQYEFDARMPREFWLELVEAFRERSGDTLLIAEAFWMTEMYFVRSLGMHRVYNSAFMHALRDEKNAEFERTLRDFRAHDPETLRRFVNYLSTPDEESAQTHFPHHDKYFGAMVLMATLPGLPMLAPGQTEGYREKYGMDQNAPLNNEPVDTYLVERHRAQITPLLERRTEFADPLAVEFPAVEKPEHVIVYVTGKSQRYLVVFNNSPHATRIFVRGFAQFFPENSERVTCREILSGEILRLQRSSLEAAGGFSLDLAPYTSKVFSEFAIMGEERAAARSLYPRYGEYIAGVAVPVSALKSGRSCGIGEFLDLKLLIDWCAQTGQTMINLLPVNDTGYNSSPYSALSALALNPVYLCLDELPLSDTLKSEVAIAREQYLPAARVQYHDVVRFKEKILRAHYEKDPSAALQQVPADFAAQDWLRDYAVFRVLKDYFGGAAWFDWQTNDAPEDIRRVLKNPTAEMRALFFESRRTETGFYVWVQYLLDSQLRAVRDYAIARGVYLKGDMPIMLERDSVDVWLNPELFNHHLRAGAPPDMFSPEGQNWGFPVYDWPAHERENFRWWRARIEQLARYFAAYRIDHVLGFFRIWSIPEGNRTGLDGFFLPSLPFAQEELQTLLESAENVAHLSRVRVYDAELAIFAEKNHDATEQIGNCRFLRYELHSESAIAALQLAQGEFSHVLVERLHRRAFLEYAGKFYPAWEFDAKLQQIHDVPESIRQKISAYVRERKMQERPVQHEQGRRVLQVLKGTSAMLPCAEDLGVVPDYVRPTLAELGILGLKVFRWEAENNIPKDPAAYPYLSLATSSVHDSSNLREWLLSEPPHVTGITIHENRVTSDNVRQFLERLYRAPSMVVMIPLQDLLALDESLHGDAKEERINVPGTVSEFNWTYRMPLSLEELLSRSELASAVRMLVRQRPISAG